jgi:predicted nucleic acid-binding protein
MAAGGVELARRRMSRVVVDTSVVSYLLKEHSLAAPYRTLLRGYIMGLSFMTLAELYRWPLQRGWGKRRLHELAEHLVGYVALDSDTETCRLWARIMSQKGSPRSIPDAWIAATALRYGCPLVTHNPRHFLPIDGLSVLTLSV